MQNLPRLCAQGKKLGIRLFVEGFERVVVFAVRDEPVDGREVLALRQLLVQAPEHLHDAQRRARHGIGKVPTRRGHRADDRHRTFPARGTEALDSPGSLVEARQPGAQVRGVPRVRGHLRKPSRDFTKRLRPPRCRVRHHGDVVPLVAEVLREGDAGVDGSLASCDGHVGRVGHQRRPLHDALLATVGKRHGELGEFREHLRHLVPALAASNVNDPVAVGVFAQRLRDDRLAAAERAWDRARASEHGREHDVQHALTG